MTIYYDTEEQARNAAFQKHADETCTIVLSEGAFYLETGETMIIRSWEKLIFQGKGKNAQNKKNDTVIPPIKRKVSLILPTQSGYPIGVIFLISGVPSEMTTDDVVKILKDHPKQAVDYTKKKDYELTWDKLPKVIKY